MARGETERPGVSVVDDSAIKVWRGREAHCATLAKEKEGRVP